MALPDCECIGGLPLNDKLDAIYCAFYTAIPEPVALPSCECVKGQPLNDKIDSIYCAILQFTQGGGGQIDPSDIQGATPYGISLLQLPAPLASALISSDGATALVLDPTDSITQNISYAQISDSSASLDAVQAASGGSDVAMYIAGGNSPANGSAGPVNNLTVVNGIATSLS